MFVCSGEVDEGPLVIYSKTKEVAKPPKSKRATLIDISPEGISIMGTSIIKAGGTREREREKKKKKKKEDKQKKKNKKEKEKEKETTDSEKEAGEGQEEDNNKLQAVEQGEPEAGEREHYDIVDKKEK